MVALRSQGNWRWEGPLGTPLGLGHWMCVCVWCGVSEGFFRLKAAQGLLSGVT